MIIDFYLTKIDFLTNILIHDVFMMSIFGVSLMMCFLLIKKTRKFYFTKNFLEF